jgi:hypothetical protein
MQHLNAVEDFGFYLHKKSQKKHKGDKKTAAKNQPTLVATKAYK